MRVLMISDVYFPRVNGVSTSTATFMRELLDLGHQVRLLAPEYPQPWEDGLPVQRVPSRSVVVDKEDRMMRWRAAWEAGLAAGRECDVVHVQTPFVAHYLGRKLARRLGVPLVESYHTFFEEYLFHYLPGVPKGLMRYLARRFSRSQCREVDALVVPSGAMLEKLRGYGVSTRAEVIPTGLDMAKFRGGDGAAFRARLGLGADTPVLVHVGRIAHEKNIDFLVAAFSRVRETIPRAVLVIAGEGPALNHVKALVERLGLTPAVHFVGYLDRRNSLLDCYRAGDAFVFASRTETQGLVLLEAMALGVPVVSTAVMGTRDILAPGRGAQVAVDDLDDFAAKATDLLWDRALRERLGREASEYAARWSARVMAERLSLLYQALVETNGAVCRS